MREIALCASPRMILVNDEHMKSPPEDSISRSLAGTCRAIDAGVNLGIHVEVAVKTYLVSSA